MSQSAARRARRARAKKFAKDAGKAMDQIAAQFEAFSAVLQSMEEALNEQAYQLTLLSIGFEVLRKKGLITDKEMKEHGAAYAAQVHDERTTDAEKEARDAVVAEGQSSLGEEGLDGDEHPWEPISDGPPGQVLRPSGFQAEVGGTEEPKEIPLHEGTEEVLPTVGQGEDRNLDTD